MTVLIYTKFSSHEGSRKNYKMFQDDTKIHSQEREKMNSDMIIKVASLRPPCLVGSIWIYVTWLSESGPPRIIAGCNKIHNLGLGPKT